MKKKITIIGAGNVGATAAHWALTRSLGDIVLLDVMEGIPQGKALDLWQSGPLDAYAGTVTGTNDYADSANSDVVIITAGLARKPGMSRDDLLAKNVAIVKSCAEEAVQHSPNCFMIVVTNPIDAMVHTAFKVTGLDKSRIIGMAGVLDSARYRTFLAEALGVAPADVNALVMGIHGDKMLPMVRLANVGGVPITDLLSEEKIAEIVERTQLGGIEIVNHLKTGSAFYTPGLAAVEMAEAVLKDSKRVLPCAAYLEGEFGISGYFLGVPVVLGNKGVERILEFSLTDAEKAALQDSVEAVSNQMQATGL
ncbi:MAG: malate dehydrogenase [Candidatus Electrothrix sp. LOE1_4_5]|jgi:malate dehydrogenase|nr:malate dehydrogenase [Candidatus Electrothrix sp. AX1]MCI5118877.1 malate dehydrogenase [Candidatus Electrothrix gigas]MCI5129789.1 malate dehydrogenase [Candidatus Electrothrix gigas]MCI5180187.1 malate dehydrogenase [Candidatus Electrothrix gigas]MCI5182562.1 malate dehydrogenase [Candidatus Electrothrix gigas]